MRADGFGRLVGILAILALPVIAHAQEATLSGTVTDTTGGVLPGVSVTAVHEASGNTFEGVTDEQGVFQIPLRTGAYRITAQLQGFAVVTRSGVELLVGQQAVVNLQLAPSTVQESVTVTGEAPLVETTRSRSGQQHRSAAALGAPGEWPELAGSDDAGGGEPGQHRVQRRPDAQGVSRHLPVER